MAKSVIIHGNTYADVPSVEIPKASGGGNAVFYDTSDADVTSDKMISGTSAYGTNGKVTGNIPSNGDTSGTISTKDGTVSVPSGYTSGGTVKLSDTAKASIVSSNIKSGATILGVSGAASVVDTTIASGGASASHILTGYKAYVNGSLVNGSASMPNISQNNTTKVLTIS